MRKVTLRYRKIDPRIWNDQKFRSLSDDGKFIFLFLLTHPHMTCLGAMRATLPGLAAELGWTAKRFRAGIEEALRQGIIEVSEEASWIGIPNFLRYNEPQGPNSVVKAWRLAVELLPECAFKRTLIQRCRSYLAHQSDKFKRAVGPEIWEAFGDGMSDGIDYGMTDAMSDGIVDGMSDVIEDAQSEACRIQEQKQEQEQEQEKEKEKEPKQDTEERKKKTSVPRTFASDSVEMRLSGLLHELILSRYPGLKQPNLQDWARSVDLMLRKDHRTAEEIEVVIRWCQEDPFWQPNILSTEKLREKYDTLNAKRIAGAVNGHSKGGVIAKRLRQAAGQEAPA